MNIDVLKNCPLFKNVPEYSITPMMGCLRARDKYYGKNEYIYHAGDKVSEIGIVMSGMVQIIKDDIWGRETMLAELSPGMLFGEAFVLGGESRISVSVRCAQRTDVLFLDGERVVKPCDVACGFHFDVSRNMIRILAEKNIFLTERVEHISKRSLREKVMSYLSGMAETVGTDSFEIPFDRQELADYLACDRSALSAVLGKLKKEGIIDFNKKNFTVYKN